MIKIIWFCGILVTKSDKSHYLGSYKDFNPIETILNTDDHNTLEFSTALNQYRRNIPGFSDFIFG
jgi:hypothetical protein